MSAVHQILRASAGTGKTFALVEAYLRGSGRARSLPSPSPAKQRSSSSTGSAVD